MDLEHQIRAVFRESAEAVERARGALVGDVARAAERMIDALRGGGRILACGNGGSACDALHFSSELLNRFERERAALPAIALVTDVATLTAVSNDAAYDEAFARQVRALAAPGDVLLAITTSGDSESVVRAVEAAHEVGATVVALTGRAGGKLGPRLTADDVEVQVPADRTARIQEVHGLVIHALCAAIEESLFPPNA